LPTIPSSNVQNRRTNKPTNHETHVTADADEDIEISPCNPEVEYINAVERLTTSRTRDFLARLTITFLLANLVASGLYGLLIGHIEIVAATWTGILATLTLVLRFYFPERKPKPK
jgi:hypothetical protein